LSPGVEDIEGGKSKGRKETVAVGVPAEVIGRGGGGTSQRGRNKVRGAERMSEGSSGALVEAGAQPRVSQGGVRHKLAGGGGG